MYRFETDVRYSEIGSDRRVRPHQIINYFQDCSVLDSEKLGKGLDYSEQRKRAWLLSAWQVEILSYPAFMQHISVGTWPYDFTSMYGYRNFDICDAAGRQMVRANSIWCIVDMETGMPVRVENEDIRGYELFPGIDMPAVSRKLKIHSEGERLEPFRVRSIDIDTNGHVNNARYIAMAEEYLPEDFMPHLLKVQYRQAAKYGQEIYPKFTGLSGGYAVGLYNDSGEPYVNIEFLES